MLSCGAKLETDGAQQKASQVSSVPPTSKVHVERANSFANVLDPTGLNVQGVGYPRVRLRSSWKRGECTDGMSFLISSETTNFALIC